MSICRGEAGKAHVDLDPRVFLMGPNSVLHNFYDVYHSAGDLLKLQILIQQVEGRA